MSNNAWFSCSDADYAWKCSVTAQISYPLSIRVTGGGETLTGYDVITSTDDGAVFDLGSNFGASAPTPMPVVVTPAPIPTPMPVVVTPAPIPVALTPAPIAVVTPSPVSGSGGSGSFIT